MNTLTQRREHDQNSLPLNPQPSTLYPSRRDFLRFAASSLGLSFAVPGLDLRATERRGTDRPKSFLTV